MRIVVASAGRRVYLIRWFKEALRRAGWGGEIYVLENDINASSIAVADAYRKLPRYEDPQYRPTLLKAIDDIKPQLFISLNDYELTELANGLAADIRKRGVVVPSLSAEAQRTVADKFAMSGILSKAGIRTPPTALLSDIESVQDILRESEHVVIKDRFGSGSSGLRLVSRETLAGWLKDHNQFRENSDGEVSNSENLIVQPQVAGEEHGLDIIAPLEGGPVAGVLARRKLVMRHGETNVAETVDSREFESLAEKIGTTLGVQGLIDVDVMRTSYGEGSVIDINPRFGGGYPFNHVAGADVPSYYISSVLGLDAGEDWHSYKTGHIAAKYEEIVSHTDFRRKP